MVIVLKGSNHGGVAESERSPTMKGAFAPTAFAPLMFERAHATGSLVMAVDEGGRELTFAGFLQQSRQLAESLTELGVTVGTRVAWQLPTWLETLVLMGALAQSGAVQIPIPHIYRKHEVEATIRQTDADVLITPTVWRTWDFGAMARDVGHGTSMRLATLDRGTSGTVPLVRPANSPDGLPPRPKIPLANGVRWIFLTSGTSSAPKGAQHTDHSVIIPSVTLTDGLALTAQDRAAIAFPLGHIGGVNWITASLLSGCQLLLAERFDDDTIEFFAGRGVTLPGVSTAFHLAYRNAARARSGRSLFPHARAYPGGGATKPPSLHAELVNEIGGVGIISGYGMTECPIITMATINDASDKLACTEGRPSREMEIRILDVASHQPVAPGDDGQIWVKGPQLFQGYLDAEATAAVMDDDGFLCTGDIGHLDHDGYMVISGRAKDVVIRKGENISAKEVEDHLYTHPSIADVAVIGLPDDELGERCCAVIVLRPNCDCPSLTELGTFLQTCGLMPQKWPERLDAMVDLPRNAAGKILKATLVEQLTDGTTPGTAFGASGRPRSPVS